MKKIISIFLINFCLSLCLQYGFAQSAQTVNEDVAKISEQIKVSGDLNKLNDCRIKLRTIEWEKLNTKDEKEQYADAYRQLAMAYRNHRYIRPGYDLYQKYISLRDTLLQHEKAELFQQIKQKNEASLNLLQTEIANAGQDKSGLLTDKTALDSLKKNNFTYCILFTGILAAVFFFIFMKFNKRLRESKLALQNNRKKILEMNPVYTRGQMLAAVISQLKNHNSFILGESTQSVLQLAQVEKELKGIKEAETSLRSLREYVTRTKQLSEISGKSISTIFQKLPVLKP